MSSGGSTGSYNNNAHLLASNNQRRRYPVVDLNDETSFRYLTTMEGLLADALASDLRKSSVHRCFDVIRETDEWSIHHRVLAPRRHEYVCFGRHTTTLASLQDAMYTSDSFGFRSVCALLYPAHIEDAALLQVMHTADRGHFFGVKFVALNAPSVTDEIASTKEFLYAEYSGMCVDAHGVSTYFVLTCPLSVTQGLRANAGCVKLYRQKSPFVVDVTTQAIVLQKQPRGRGNRGSVGLAVQYAQSQGHLMYWKPLNVLIPRGLAKDLLPLPHEATLPESRQLTTGSFAEAWGHSQKCVTCQKSFYLLRPKHHCRHCGWSMCGNCKTALPCVDRVRDDGVSVSTEKFCKSCLVQARLAAHRETQPPILPSRSALEQIDLDAFEAIQLYDPPHEQRITEENLDIFEASTNQLVEFNDTPRRPKMQPNALHPLRGTVLFESPSQRGSSMIRLYDLSVTPPSNQMDLLADYEQVDRHSPPRSSLSTRPSCQRY